MLIMLSAKAAKIKKLHSSCNAYYKITKSKTTTNANNNYTTFKNTQQRNKRKRLNTEIDLRINIYINMVHMIIQTYVNTYLVYKELKELKLNLNVILNRTARPDGQT